MRARGCQFQIVGLVCCGSGTLAGNSVCDHRQGRPRNSVVDQSKKTLLSKKHAPVGVRNEGLSFDVCIAGLLNRCTSTGGFGFGPVSLIRIRMGEGARRFGTRRTGSAGGG